MGSLSYGWRPAAVAFASRRRCPRRRAHPLHRFLIDATLGTARFDASYRAKHALPNLDNYWYIDVVCSKTKPSATLLILSAYMR